MGDSYTDDFFCDLYKSELEHKDKLDSADSLLIAVLLALSGVGIYYAKLLPAFGFGVAGYAFLGCAVLFLIVFCVATGFVIASFWPRDKEHIAPPEEWGKFADGLRDYYTHYHNEQDADKRVASDLALALRKKYIQAGEVNRRLNIKKMAYQARARYTVTAAVVLIMLNAVPTYFVQSRKTETQKTEVVGFPEIQKVEIVIPKPKDKSNERTKTATPANPGTTKDGPTETGPAKARTSQEHGAKGRSDNGPPEVR
jgi:hypothetical protein